MSKTLPFSFFVPMIIHVEACWGGGERHYFRLTTPNGSRETIRGEVWNRKAASKALDLFENISRLKRSTIRFKVR